MVYDRSQRRGRLSRGGGERCSVRCEYVRLELSFWIEVGRYRDERTSGVHLCRMFQGYQSLFYLNGGALSRGMKCIV